jgi:hypothetical protein
MRLAALLGAIAIASAFAATSVQSAARTHAMPTPSPTPAPVADPQITKLAKQQFVAWQAGVVNQHLYAQQVLDKLTDAKIADTSRALGQLGPLDDVVYVGPWFDESFPAGARGYIFQMRCLSGNIYLWLALDPQGKIATIFFKNRLDTETVTPAPSPS